MLQQAMDRDPGEGAQDYRCGPQTYDGHQGTDIRLPDMAALDLDIRVLAAADGMVLGIRNGVPDTGQGGFPEGQDCGNGVVLDHGDGWQTQYCHLAQGSVTVAAGDRVTAGQPIGTIGFSGNTEFPHLHLSVRRDGAHIDPFDPSETHTCGQDAPSLWADGIDGMPPGGILSIGFADAVPGFDAIRAGTAGADTLPTDADALVLWGFVHGGRVVDRIEFHIAGPDGSEFHAAEAVLERTQAELFRASGRRLNGPVAPGTYHGTVTLIREDTPIDSAEIAVDLR